MATKKQKVQVCILRELNRELELLLLQVNSGRGGFKQNMTGKMDPGENPLETAVREIYEETGLKVTTHDLQDLEYKFEYKGIEEFCFVLFLTSSVDITISSEHQSYEWLKATEVTEDHFGFKSNYEFFLKAKDWYENRSVSP